MNRKSVVLVILLLSSGAAFAKDQNISSVQVRPSQQESLEMACAGQAKPAPAQVERLLNITDRTQTNELGNRLMGAVGEACRAGVSDIVVARAASGHSLTWRAARGAYEANVALR
jgi:hypothetical protein